MIAKTTQGICFERQTSSSMGASRPSRFSSIAIDLNVPRERFGSIDIEVNVPRERLIASIVGTDLKIAVNRDAFWRNLNIGQLKDSKCL